MIHASVEIMIMNTNSVVNSGTNRIPQGVLFNAKLNNGIIAMLIPKLSAIRSITSK